MTICPCCGFKFHGTLSAGCKGCGARAVGEPLPRPAHELPSFGRALILSVSGALVVLVFITQVLIAFAQKSFGSFGLWTWIAAGETAAWRMKWLAIPLFLAILWFGRKLYRSILLQPERFCGLKYARRGLIASATVAVLLAILIGITVPARLEQRRLAHEAAVRARGYVIMQALTAYTVKYQTLPADLVVLQRRTPDPDGTLAEALANIDPSTYLPSADVAAVATVKSRSLSGAVIRKSSLSSATDDTPSGGLSFTNYRLRLPGEDKITGTDDDWVIRDGMIMKLSDVAKGGVGSSASVSALQP